MKILMERMLEDSILCVNRYVGIDFIFSSLCHIVHLYQSLPLLFSHFLSFIKGFTTVPSDHVCPTALDVSKDDCVAAGLGVGGRLRHDEIVEGAFYWTPPGCFIEPKRFGDIHWNNDINGVNDQRYTSVCRKVCC
jgi:hypothetical protein